MNEQPVPPGWGDDELSEFIGMAVGNIYATFVRLRSEYRQLRQVDDQFTRVAGNLTNTRSLYAGMLLLRSHSSYRGACRLAMSGQVIECYSVLRSGLENALYALHMHKHEGTGETWLRRHDDDEANAACRREFSNRRVMTTLQEEDPAKHAVAEMLYERLIDFGAHPNERSVTSSLRISHTADDVELEQIYLSVGPIPLKHALKTTAQVGLCSLYVFRRVFRERFDLLGVTDQLDTLATNL